MRRREFIALLGGVVAPLACVRSGLAQPRTKPYRIGILETISPSLNAANLAGFRQGMQELGYVEGRDTILEYRSADGASERFPALASELVALGVDVIVTRGTPAAIAAKTATSTIPIIMAAIGEPIGPGVVAQLARPGGNVTGLSAFVTELHGKRIELMKEMLPSTKRVGALLNMGNPVVPPQWRETQTAARALQLEAELLDVRNSSDIELAFRRAVEARVDAIAVGPDAVTQVNRRRIAELAAAHRIAAIYPSKEFVEDGGFASYGVNYPHLYFRAAGFVDSVLKGSKPGDLPVQQPTKFEFVINLKAAKMIGVEVPSLLLARADEVIE